MASRRGEVAYETVPHLEAQLRTEIDAGAADTAVEIFDRLIHRHRRIPQQVVCTRLLELCVTRLPRRTFHVLENMAEQRGLDVEDYCRIVRLLIFQHVSSEELARFEEAAIDILSFSDDGLHNYFAHFASLLNLELHEQMHCSGGPSDDSLEISQISHKRMLDALAKLCKRAQAITPIIALLLHGMGGREGAQDDAELQSLAAAATGLSTEAQLASARERLKDLTHLNSSQRGSVDAALTRRLTLIQGPPGTGKTTVASELIAIWVQRLGIRPVLACADSNVAIDNLGAALLKLGLQVVRVGRQEAVAEDLHAHMPDRLGGPAAIGAADVVLSTCIGSGAEGSVGRFVFPAVLLDETAQSTEPACLVPLALGCRQLVLVGDHKQLRPTVVSEDAARRGLQLSLFERMLRAGVEPCMLDTQYRMHPSLAAFPSDEFYHGRLLSGEAMAPTRPQLRGFRWPRPQISVALIPSTSAEDGGGSSLSKRNSGEASSVVSVVRNFLAAGELSARQIGVVTPYAAQVRLLRQMLGAHPEGRRVECLSVDGFQGREKDLIVFSAVRAGGRALGFVADARRLNVLLTRARRGLIVIGARSAAKRAAALASGHT